MTTTATIRRSEQRGVTQLAWLDSKHSFSFGHYHDPSNMGFGPLRVINDDWIAPDGGFGMPPHRDMEIITYISVGAVEHKDSLGSGSVIRKGDIQLMRAGTGIMHSEFNPSSQEGTRLLQIWIEPDERGLDPYYQEAHRSAEDYPDQFRILVDPQGTDGALKIRQDAALYALDLAPGKTATLELGEDRAIWLQMVTGVAEIDGQRLQPGDALTLTSAQALTVMAEEHIDALVFSLPPQDD